MAETVAVSVSGAAAAREAMGAINSGKNVVLLGGGVSVAEEIELKKAASDNGLLLLGPACGTAVLDGEGFGFWNSVQDGPIGIIGTFGSGIQQVACLVGKVGISQALDVGSRDLSQRVNAWGTLTALNFLESDQKTEVIVILSRSPATSIERRVLDAARSTEKPTVFCFLGEGINATRKGLIQAKNFEEAALQAVALSRKRGAHEATFPVSREVFSKLAESEHERLGYGQKYIRGFYSGGALCTEAMIIIKKSFSTVYSNLPLSPRLRLPDPRSGKGHACIDFGAESLAEGQHPAANLVPRCNRIMNEAKNWETAVVMLDVLLGHGAHKDPAGELAIAVKEAKDMTERMGGYLSVVASIIGTDKDPQNLKKQQVQLERAGVLVAGSNAQAARTATAIATGGKTKKN